MRQLDFLADSRELIHYDARGSGQTDITGVEAVFDDLG